MYIKRKQKQRAIHLKGNCGTLMQIFLISVQKSIECKPPSLPIPDDFTPPNGTLKSLCNQQLIQTIPVSIFCATLCAFVTSFAQTLAANPYSVQFAISTTSDSVSNECTVTTGPNISCVAHCDLNGDKFDIIVGR